MTRQLKVSLPGLFLIAALLACNLPLEQFPPPSDMQTAAALTLQAILTPSFTAEAFSPIASPPPATRTPSPRVTGTPATATISPTTAVSQTPTYSLPILTVREPTNCRTGPGEAYEVVFTYLAGKQLEIAGRYDPGNFWLVKSSQSPTGTCWTLRLKATCTS